MNRELGVTVVLVEQAIERCAMFREDPITIESGVGDELQPLVNRATMLEVEVELRRRGYRSYRELIVEVEDRTCDHWINNCTLLLMLDDLAGVGFFSGDAYQPDMFDPANEVLVPRREHRPTSTGEPRADEMRDGWEGQGYR